MELLYIYCALPFRLNIQRYIFDPHRRVLLFTLFYSLHQQIKFAQLPSNKDKGFVCKIKNKLPFCLPARRSNSFLEMLFLKGKFIRDSPRGNVTETHKYFLNVFYSGCIYFL